MKEILQEEEDLSEIVQLVGKVGMPQKFVLICTVYSCSLLCVLFMEVVSLADIICQVHLFNGSET